MGASRAKVYVRAKQSIVLSTYLHMTYSIVIPSWKGISLLKQNLPAVLKLPAMEVIVMDDASPENDIEFLQQNFPQVKAYRNEKNFGFGTNVNRGVAKATGDIIILLNLDARPAPDLLSHLEQHFLDPKVFAVSFAEQEHGPSRMIFKDGYISHQPILPIPATTSSTFWVSGGSGAFRRSTWNELGGLDPIYDPFYWEDVDLCIRASQSGYQLLWEPQARVEHHHESTIGKHIKPTFKTRIQERNHLLITWKHMTLAQWPVHVFFLIKRMIQHPGYLRIMTMALSRKFLGP